MDRLDAAHHKHPIRARSAEERHVVARPGHDVFAADELAGAAGANPGLERADSQGDNLAVGCVEPPAGRVDAEDAAPQAGRPGWRLRPAFLPAPECAAAQGAPGRAEKQERERNTKAARSE